MMRNFFKIKKYTLIFLCLVLLYTFYIFFRDDDIKYSNQIYNDNLVLNILINNQLCSYDKNSNSYFFSTNMTDYKKWNIKLSGLHELKYNIFKIDDYNYYIRAFDSEYYQNINLTITPLPIVDLQKNDLRYSSFSSSLFENSSYDHSFYNFDSKMSDDEYYAHFLSPSNVESKYVKSKIKIRGSSSIMYPKKSYKIELDKNVDVFDLPKDDKYVLDALYVDKSKVRNLLSSNIWNLINDNQVIQNDLKGEFVEFFIDNEYIGLYVLKEKVDKSVTKISDDGLLLKSIDHLYNYYIDDLLNLNDDYIPYGSTFLSFELKKFNLNSFSSFIKKFKSFHSNYSYSSICNNYDMNNYINYMIFVALISGSDNIYYNYYLSLQDYNSNVLITPWDMDLTFGLNTWNIYWNDDIFENYIHNESSQDTDWMNDNITFNMDSKTFDLLKQRYWELRKDVITMQTINEYLNLYKDILVNSGVAKRDSDRWYEYDVEYEIEQIREWANHRIQFLDEYFK